MFFTLKMWWYWRKIYFRRRMSTCKFYLTRPDQMRYLFYSHAPALYHFWNRMMRRMFKPEFMKRVGKFFRRRFKMPRGGNYVFGIVHDHNGKQKKMWMVFRKRKYDELYKRKYRLAYEGYSLDADFGIGYTCTMMRMNVEKIINERYPEELLELEEICQEVRQELDQEEE